MLLSAPLGGYAILVQGRLDRRNADGASRTPSIGSGIPLPIHAVWARACAASMQRLEGARERSRVAGSPGVRTCTGARRDCRQRWRNCPTALPSRKHLCPRTHTHATQITREHEPARSRTPNGDPLPTAPQTPRDCGCGCGCCGCGCGCCGVTAGRLRPNHPRVAGDERHGECPRHHRD